jgi:serine/threonine-protein kinase
MAASKVFALMRLLGKPIEIPLDDNKWLSQQLPRQEINFFRRARIELLAPVVVAQEDVRAVLALGHKLSEEPYSGEDRELLHAVAASLALLLERSESSVRASSRAQECPACGNCYESNLSRCPRDGETLVKAGWPRLLADRYRLERRIGSGGMGTVYRATDLVLERRVAAKLVREHLLSDPQALRRFRREAQSLARFTHPGVVAVYDFGVVAGSCPFLIMELLGGTTLRKLMQSQGRLVPSRTIDIMGSVCAAVAAAHEHHLIHRDLKPENVFLTSDGAREIPKILDFGVAKVLDITNTPDELASRPAGSTQTGTIAGTLSYMAPEQLAGGAAQLSWDIWALAVMVYEMLTGAHPFQNDAEQVWRNVLLGKSATPIHTYLPEAPSTCQDFFSRALAQDPAQRPGSALMLFSELEQVFEAHSRAV